MRAVPARLPSRRGSTSEAPHVAPVKTTESSSGMQAGGRWGITGSHSLDMQRKAEMKHRPRSARMQREWKPIADGEVDRAITNLT